MPNFQREKERKVLTGGSFQSGPGGTKEKGRERGEFNHCLQRSDLKVSHRWAKRKRRKWGLGSHLGVPGREKKILQSFNDK